VASSSHPFDVAVTESILRERQSAKWRQYGPDVLPAWVAEMDYPLADPIKRVLHAAIDLNDTGYADPRGLGDAFAPFAMKSWGWSVDPKLDVMVAPDVVTAICELLLVTTKEGDGVVIDPPVYFPFAESIKRLNRRVVNAPVLSEGDSGWALNFDAIEHAYAGGAKMHILCSPHNPTGMVIDEGALVRLADLADRHGVLVLSDEIHAPMTHAGKKRHHPFPAVSEKARRNSIVLTSASKTWNLPGLKASVMVACDDRTRELMRRVPMTLPYHAGLLGVIAARAAWSDEGGEWLKSLLVILDRNRRLLGDLLRTHLPQARYVMPEAGYLAWIDCRALGLGGDGDDDPTKVFLEKGKVALSSGPMFGPGGEGFTRLNFATTKTLLEESVRRMGMAATSAIR
jgi:cysteine-S-conjugate beta-lyase